MFRRMRKARQECDFSLSLKLTGLLGVSASSLAPFQAPAEIEVGATDAGALAWLGTVPRCLRVTSSRDIVTQVTPSRLTL